MSHCSYMEPKCQRPNSKEIVAEAPYRAAPWERDLIKQSVQDLLNQGLVLETSSP